jgi:pyridoxine 5'-phosphate synthase PdxJ
VVILYHNDNIQHIIKQIQAQDKDVVLFTMPDKKDVCWLTERPKTDIIESITARKFDILIDLTQEPSRTLQYMAMYIRADFKVGRFIREGIHDLTIDTPPQAAPDYLLEQILRYIDMFGIK